MTHSHRDTVTLLYPQAAEKRFACANSTIRSSFLEKTISDPIGGSYDIYLDCRDKSSRG